MWLLSICDRINILEKRFSDMVLHVKKEEVDDEEVNDLSMYFYGGA